MHDRRRYGLQIATPRQQLLVLSSADVSVHGVCTPVTRALRASGIPNAESEPAGAKRRRWRTIASHGLRARCSLTGLTPSVRSVLPDVGGPATHCEESGSIEDSGAGGWELARPLL